jgi:hypothetical protein
MTDTNDSSVSLANSGMLNVTPGAATPMGMTGDGTSTQFQLARQIGAGGWDVIQNNNGNPTSVRVNGTPTGAYSLSSTGVVTFSSAPASSANLTWAGDIYFLCRFTDDSLADLARTGFNATSALWSVSNIKFESVLI